MVTPRFASAGGVFQCYDDDRIEEPGGSRRPARRGSAESTPWPRGPSPLEFPRTYGRRRNATCRARPAIATGRASGGSRRLRRSGRQPEERAWGHFRRSLGVELRAGRGGFNPACPRASGDRLPASPRYRRVGRRSCAVYRGDRRKISSLGIVARRRVDPRRGLRRPRAAVEAAGRR